MSSEIISVTASVLPSGKRAYGLRRAESRGLLLENNANFLKEQKPSLGEAPLHA